MFRSSLNLVQHRIKTFGTSTMKLSHTTLNPTILQQHRQMSLDVISINVLLSSTYSILFYLQHNGSIDEWKMARFEKKNREAYVNNQRPIPTVELNPHFKTIEGDIITIDYHYAYLWLREQLSRSPFFLLYGPSSYGKTNAILYFVEALQKEGHNVEYVPLRVAGREPDLSMLKKLGDTSKGDDIHALQTSIKDRLTVQLQKTKKKSVIIIDDAQKLNYADFLLSLVETGLARVVFVTDNDNPDPSHFKSNDVRNRLEVYRFLPLNDDMMLNLIKQCGFTNADSVFNMIDFDFGGLIQMVDKYNELKKNGEEGDLFDKTVKAVIEERRVSLLYTIEEYPKLKKELFEVFDLLPSDINGDTIQFFKYPHLIDAVKVLHEKNSLTCDSNGCYRWRYQLDALAYSQYKQSKFSS